MQVSCLNEFLMEWSYNSFPASLHEVHSLVPRPTRLVTLGKFPYVLSSFRVGKSCSSIANYCIVITFYTLETCSRLIKPFKLTSGRSLARPFYFAITNSYLPRDFECSKVRNVIAYAVMLTVHIQECWFQSLLNLYPPNWTPDRTPTH